MDEIGERISKMVEDVQELTIDEGVTKNIIKKRKNWTSPGVDGIQNYWWKRFSGTWNALSQVFNNIVDDPQKIEEWFTVGVTALLPKSVRLDNVAEYRPITCLNTIYKLFTGVLAGHMKEHAVKNKIWDECQMGTQSGVLGTIDQLIVDNCIMEEVKEHKRNLVVAYYDYKKAYDRVYHDWMLMVYKWMALKDKVCEVLEKIMSMWKTKLAIRREDGSKVESRWIKIKRGFLQGDSYSPVGFCLSEVPIGMLISDAPGYEMGAPNERRTRKTHALFIDDLKIYSEDHSSMEVMNRTITKASQDIGAAYGVKKCAEAVFERGRMVKGKGLDVLGEKMKSLNPQLEEVYKFLGCEQGTGIDAKAVIRRVVEEISHRLDVLLDAKLLERNLIKAINTRVIPVAVYPMNVCKFTDGDLYKLDMVIKSKLRGKNMHGKQASDERLYLGSDEGGRGLKSFKDAYIETKIRIAAYMAMSTDKWLKIAWKREMSKEFWSIKRVVEDAFEIMGDKLKLTEGEVLLNEERLTGNWKKVKEKLSKLWKRRVKERRIRSLKNKPQQGEVFKKLENADHIWMKKNIDPVKVGSIINMQEQMIETRAWKKVHVDCVKMICAGYVVNRRKLCIIYWLVVKY